jgi:hypothetical protein
MTSRICRDDERDEILSIINAAAEAYHGVISADCWHDPYMSGDELDRELATGVAFWGYEDGGRLAGVRACSRCVTLSLFAMLTSCLPSSGTASAACSSAIFGRSAQSRCWLEHGRPPSGRSAFMSVTVLH